MSTRHRGLAVVAQECYFYAVRDHKENGCVGRAEVSTPQDNTWNFVSSMTRQCSHFSLKVINEQIYVVGGHTCSLDISSGKCYDGTNDQWFLTCNMKNHKPNLRCCVTLMSLLTCHLYILSTVE
ncbi:kelch 10 [Solea senegalensis]|uniref:Kelch 10 n=1 Tax=Solea senegalensis TaxID=28829 RepID=A0AAV6T5B6_SOLSE|nr:kelch 10 [Solea senegalensis]